MTKVAQHSYRLIVEKPYCCVPTTIQMILERRGLTYASQENIGNELGLIVPPEMASQFSNVRTGAEPKSGYGTQISKDEFSIANYFKRQQIPLTVENYKPRDRKDLENIIETTINNNDDIAICYDSQQLFGDGDREHFSLVQSINKDRSLEIIDPAIGAPLLRITTIQKLFQILNSHNISNIGGVWLIASSKN